LKKCTPGAPPTFSPTGPRSTGRKAMVSQALADVLRFLRCTTSDEQAEQQGDGPLLRRVSAGRDEEAFAVLLQRHGPMVLGVCRQVLRDTHDAEDAFQATFLVLARKAASIRRQESLAAWLHRVAVNISRTASADTARRRAYERQAVLLSGARAVDDVALRECQLLLHAEVDRLPPKYRVPVILCYFEGQSHDEAAHQLGWPLGTVKGRLARARQLLRTRLVRRGLALTAAGIGAALAQGAAAVAVPPALLAPTLRGALSFATGGAVAGASVSAKALALATGAVQGMTGTMATRLVALLLAVGLIASLVAATAPQPQRGAAAPAPEQA